ncbi:hypothetical protein G6F43_011443 [Rhizopus delemar]|nr:hypothetical protein G6F43_011443 [Rhizopus delemar]
MFSKSKRFPTAEKEYIPGPGEYDVNVDDGSRHKRYGFLSQSDRFSEEHTEDDGYSTATLSSDILSKNSIPKSIQKEYDILLTKSKRMETMIQTLENEKKSIQLAKDMELADIRSKNAALQKTINRQEKQIKANTWQKRMEQLEEDYKKKLSEKERQMIVLQQELSAKTTDLEETRHVHAQQMQQSSEQLREAKECIQLLKEDTANKTAQINEYERMHAEDAAQIRVQQGEMTALHDRIKHDECILQGLRDQLESKDQVISKQALEMDQQMSLVQSLQTQFKLYRQHTTQVTQQQRETKCQGHRTELNELLSEVHEAKKFINQQAIHINHLKSDVYWLTSRCEQAEQILKDMHRDRSEQFGFQHALYHHQPYVIPFEKEERDLEQRIQETRSSSASTVSYSSRSTLSFQGTEVSQSK